MSTSVWSGNVNLENICLNASNLNNDSSLQLPFSITKGTIRRLSLSVDWKTWYARKHPINIRVSGVVLQCSPREEDDWFQAFGAVASSLEAEDIARRKLQKSIDDIVSIQEDPALMAIWAPLFASVHVELKDLTITFKDISPKPNKDETDDNHDGDTKHLSEISVCLDCLRIMNPDDDNTGSGSSEIASALYNQVSSADFMETRVKSIDVTGFRIALDCDHWTPRGWFPEHPFHTIPSHFRERLSEGSPSSNLIRIDNTTLLLRVSRRKKNRGFTAAIVTLNEDAIQLALTPAQLISIAHLESAVKVWKRRIEYAFAKRPLIKDGKNWKEWWQYAKRAALRRQRKSAKSIPNRPSKKTTEAITSRRLSEIVQDAISASSSYDATGAEDKDNSIDDTDDEMDEYDDAEYAEEEEMFASLGLKSSSTLTGLHLRRRLKRGLEATASVATKLSFTTIEHMHQREQRRRRDKRSKLNKLRQSVRIKLHQQILEDTGCIFQVAIPKIAVRLQDNFGADKCIELVYEKVYVCFSEEEESNDQKKNRISDFKIVLQNFSAYVVSGDKKTEILRGNDNHKQASVTLKTTKGQNRTSLVVAPLKIAIDPVSLDVILQFAANKVPKSSLFANRLSATLFPLCEALKLNTTSRLQTVKALVEAREYAKQMDISLQGLSVCLVNDEAREPLLCAGFDRLISTSGGIVMDENDEINVLVGTDTYMNNLLESAIEIDIASLNELENIAGTVKSSFAVDNVYIGTNVSGSKTLILNDWSASIISEENTVNRTQRFAVQRFDPISLVFSPAVIESLSMLSDVLSQMQVKKMDVSNWHSDKLFKVSAMIAPPIILDASISLPDIDIKVLDENEKCYNDDNQSDFWLQVKVKGFAFDAASTIIMEEAIAWSVLKIDSVSMLCERNTIASVSDILISRAERKDENVCIHGSIVGVEVDASLHDCIATIQKFTSASTETHSDSNRGSFSLLSQHAPSSYKLDASPIRWENLPTRRVLSIDDVLPCVDFVSRAVLEVTESNSVVTVKLERVSVACSLSECKNADSVSLDIPGGVELTTIPVSTTSEVYMKMNEINLILTTEDGYSQSASISSGNVMTTTDFKSFSGKWSITVPWKIDSVSTVLIAHFGASVNFMSGVDVVIEDGYVCVGKSKYGAQEAVRVSRTSSRLLDVKSIHVERREDLDELNVDVAPIEVRLTSTHISILDSFSKNVISEFDRVCKRGAVLPSPEKEVDRPLSSLSSAYSSPLASMRGMEKFVSNSETGDGDNVNCVAKNIPNSAKLRIRHISVRIDDDRYSMEHPVPVSYASLMNISALCTKRKEEPLESQHVSHAMEEIKINPLSLSVSFEVCGGTYDTLRRMWEFAVEPVAFKSTVETASKSFSLTISPIDFVVHKAILESLAVSNAIINCGMLRSAVQARDFRKVEPFQCFWLKNSSGVDLSYEMLTNKDTSLGGTCISNGEVAVRYGDSWKDDASEYIERRGGDIYSPQSSSEMNNEYKCGLSGSSTSQHPTVIGLKIRLPNASEVRNYLSLDNLESKARKCAALPKSVWGGAEGDSCSLVAEIRFRENAVKQREVVLRSNLVVHNSTLKSVVLSFAGKSTFGPIKAGERKYLPLSLASLDSFVWKFEGESDFSSLPSDEISLNSIDSFIPVNARRCAIVISSDEESVTRTIAFVTPLELRNLLPVPVKASFLSGNRKFSSFVVAPRSTAIVEESEDVLDAAMLSFVPLGYVCTRSSIYIPTFSNLSRRRNPLKVFRHASPSVRRNTSEKNDEDVTTLECSVYLDKNTSSRVVSITCAMTLTNLTTQSLTLKYADIKSIASGRYRGKLDSLDESCANTIVCPPTPPSKCFNEMRIVGATERTFEYTAESDASSKAALFTRMRSAPFSSSDLESSFTSTPVRTKLSTRFQSTSPNDFGVSSAGVYSHLSRFSSDSRYTLPSSSSERSILAMTNNTSEYPRILGDSRQHRRESDFGIFTLGCGEYASDPFKLATASGKFKIVHVKPYYCYVVTTIYDDSDGGCAHIFVRPKGTITNSTKCIIAFKESDFEESDGIILMPGHTAHVRSKKPSNDGTSDIASGSGRKEESSKDIEDVPRVRIRPASSAQERWNWSDEITASTAWCRCSRALSLDQTKDNVHFSVQFNESEEDGCYNIDVIAGKHFVNRDDDDVNDEKEELPGVTDMFQTSPPPKLVRRPSSSSTAPFSPLLSSSVSLLSEATPSSLAMRTKPFFLENFRIKVASIGLSARYEKTELVNGRIHGISVMMSENCKDHDANVLGDLIVERIEINTSISREENESPILLSIPNAEMRTANIGATYFTSARNAITLKINGRIFSRHGARSGSRVTVDVAPVRIDLPEILLKKVPGFITECDQSLDVLEKPKLETRLKMERNRNVKSKRSKRIEDAVLFRIDKLSISDVPIVLSFTELPFVPFLFSKLAAVERAKITLSGFKNQKALAFPDEVLKALERHVKNQAAGRVRDLIKHNALLGDPARLVESTRHAVHELSEGNGLKAFARVTFAFGRSGLTALNRIKSIADGWVEEFDYLENQRRRSLRNRHILSSSSSSSSSPPSNVDSNTLPTCYSGRVVDSVCKAVMDIIQNPITGLECRGLIGMAEGSVFGAISGISRILAVSIEGPLSVANTFFR